MPISLVSQRPRLLVNTVFTPASRISRHRTLAPCLTPSSESIPAAPHPTTLDRHSDTTRHLPQLPLPKSPTAPSSSTTCILPPWTQCPTASSMGGGNELQYTRPTLSSSWSGPRAPRGHLSGDPTVSQKNRAFSCFYFCRESYRKCPNFADSRISRGGRPLTVPPPRELIQAFVVTGSQY